MLYVPESAQATTRKIVLDNVRAIGPRLAARVEAAEQARKIPAESIRDMVSAGLARLLVPRRFGGYELDFDTWLDAILEISMIDASHGWCASIMVHHSHMVGQFPAEAQEAVWADGPD